ncbi:hypothetical protein N8Z76_00405 [Gammaproteobacteria bacterium]|nr:hypothetical protein [Gammaproteobacteria bacterium]
MKRVKRTRNGGKLSEAAYWSKVRSALRKSFAAWEPANQAMKAARRPYNGPNKRQKFEVQCNHCKEWFKMKDVKKDHVIPVGSLRCIEDLPGFLQRLTPEGPAAFQMLCEPCHQTLTNKERNLKSTDTNIKKRKHKIMG